MAEVTGRGLGAPGRRTRSADVRAALVDAAAAVLERDGIAGLTVRAVAAEAQVAPMGVYNHLDGKGGLLTAVLQRGFDGLRAAITPPAVTPVTERLPESGRGYRRFALANPHTYALMFSTADSSIDVEAVGPHADPTFQALVDLVIEGQGLGTIRPDDAAGLAMQIWSAVHGGVTLELAGNQQAVAGPEESWELLLALITRGIAPDS